LADDKESINNIDEAFHGAAYNYQSLGRPQMPLSSATESISHELLQDWNTALFADPSKIVVAGANVPHEALVSLASQYLGKLQKNSNFILANTPAKYVGGDSRTHNAEGGVQVALGFGTPGFAQLGKKYIAYNLLHFILGSGADFSAGGPGKGIHTRLSQEIAHTNHSVMSVGAQLRPYADSGLFYVEASVAEDGKRITDQIIAQFEKLDRIAQKDFKNDDEIIRAKNRLKSHYFQTSEDEGINASDLAYQVLLQGSRPSSSELFSALDQVSGADISSAVRSLLSTKPTFVALGNLAGVPAYHEIERRFSK
jgi:processing peptidase subunit alpha